MSNFSDGRKNALLHCFLSSGQFAEDVSYLPTGGAPRTVRALVRPARGQLRDRPTEIASLEEIDVRLAKDEAAAFGATALGGVAQPQLGDGLVRTAGGDDASLAYSFAFALESTEHSWLLRFERETPRQIGTEQTRK